MTSRELSQIEAVRRVNEASQDPRAGRTRARIFDAVETLAYSGKSPIAVGDVLREAGVSKTAFYSHFAGFDDLALQVVGRAYRRLTTAGGSEMEPADHRSRTSVRVAYRRLVEHYVQHRAFYVAVVGLQLSRTVHTDAVRAMAADIEEAIAENPRLPDGLRPHLAASFIASAVVGFLDEWVEGDFDASADDLLRHLVALLPTWYVGDEE